MVMESYMVATETRQHKWVAESHPLSRSKITPKEDLFRYNLHFLCSIFIKLQFPVKWNAFSDRNGMLFSGLTEWLSDTNGMAQ